MDNKDIRELAALMKEMGLTSLAFRSGSDSVKLERPQDTAHSAEVPGRAAYAEKPNEEADPAGVFTVTSPMVGVYYAAPGADEEPYVAVGDRVHSGDVLCIIETMKIMNEITAERDGVVAEICVENKQVVEFRQPLFRISV